jgi:hypothetical protein
MSQFRPCLSKLVNGLPAVLPTWRLVELVMLVLLIVAEGRSSQHTMHM